MTLDEFKANLHDTADFLSEGEATVLGQTMPAVLVRSLYGQLLVWGMFSCEKGKFKGKLSNSALTEGVRYTDKSGVQLNWTPPFGDFGPKDPVPEFKHPSMDHLSDLVKDAILDPQNRKRKK